MGNLSIPVFRREVEVGEFLDASGPARQVKGEDQYPSLSSSLQTCTMAHIMLRPARTRVHTRSHTKLLTVVMCKMQDFGKNAATLASLLFL